MPIDPDRIDDATLALLYLGLHDGYRAWKTFDWEATNRLHAKGLLDDPRGKTKALTFTEAGRRKAQAAFTRLFGEPD